MRKISAGVGLVVVPTLIAGVYGMNFDHMPELGVELGYPFALALMVAERDRALDLVQAVRLALSRGRHHGQVADMTPVASSTISRSARARRGRARTT